ncbi:E3 ubiquitin-protein ligase ATL6 [Bienertia sinuspersici]
MKSRPKVIALVVVILEIIFCFSIYFVCLCIGRRRQWQQYNQRQLSKVLSEDTTSVAESVLVFFPYYIAKVLLGKTNAMSLRCATCLDEFKDGVDETLRLVPTCRHVFHPLCFVDPCSVTCPCCPTTGPTEDHEEAQAHAEMVEEKVVEITVEENDKVTRLPEDVMEKIIVHAKLISQTGKPCSPTKFLRK